MEIAQIDIEIRELVAVLNCIPYVSTIESCSGHLVDKLNIYYNEKNIEIKSDKGMKFMKYGAMLFNIDSKYESYAKFLDDIEDLKKKYDFAEFFENKGHKTLLLNFADLTKNNEINENDSLEILVKKMHQVPEAEGAERINKFNSFWEDFLKIAKKYDNN